MQTSQELTHLVRVAVNVFDAYTALLFKAEDQMLSLIVSHSLSKQVRKRFKVEFAHGLLGWVASNKKSLSAAKFREQTHKLPYYKREENIKSFIAAPLLYNEELLGVLSVDSKTQYKFTEKEQKILEDLAGQFALILKRQQKEPAEEKKADSQTTRTVIEICHSLESDREEELLNATVRLAKQLLDADACFIARTGRKENWLEVLRADGLPDSDFFLKTFREPEGLTGLIMKERNPLLVSDDKREKRGFQFFSPQEPKNRFSSFIGLPLMDGEHPLGILGCARNKGKAPFSYRELSLAKILGKQTSLRWSNILLRRQLGVRKQIDSLTGFLNHGSFMERISSEIDCTNFEDSFSIILVNLDQLDYVNRRYGYHYGNRLIEEVARFLEAFLAEKDAAARFSGKTLALLMPKVKRPAALKIAEEIRSRAEMHIFVIKPYEIKTTLSLVAASCFDPASTRDELVSSLEAGLKERENNSIVCIEPESTD